MIFTIEFEGLYYKNISFVYNTVPGGGAGCRASDLAIQWASIPPVPS